MIFDQFKRIFKPKTRPERTETKASIRDRWSTYPSGGLTPEKLASLLKQADWGDVSRQAELFEEMEEKDTHLSAELLKRKNAVNSLDFDILPYEEGQRSKVKGKKTKEDKVTDFCREVVFSMNGFEDGLFDLLDAIGKGFAMSWIKWEIAGGKAVVTDLEWVHQKRLSFVKDFVPALITETNLYGEEIPAFQSIYHRHKARSGYDTRAGLLRVCAWMYLFKNYSMKDWVAFAEVFGMPLRVGKHEPGATKEDKDALAAAIKALGSDAAGIISKSTEIEFVDSVKGMSGPNVVFEKLADFCNKEMSKAIIGGTLTSEVGDTGSYAASQTHNEVRLDLVKSDCWSLANTIRMQLLRPLVGFNFGWDVPVPWFRFELQEPEDLKVLSEVYQNVIGFGQPVSAEHVSDRFNIPMPEKGETVLEVPTAPPVPGSFGSAGSRFENKIQNKRIAAKSRLGEDLSPADTLDALGDKTLATASLDPLLSPIVKLLGKAGSLEEFRDSLLDLYGELDETDLGNLMQRAFALADLAGRFDV